MQRTCNYLERHTWLCGRRGRIFIKGPGQERIIKSFTKGEALQNRVEGEMLRDWATLNFPVICSSKLPRLSALPSIRASLPSFLPSFLEFRCSGKPWGIGVDPRVLRNVNYGCLRPRQSRAKVCQHGLRIGHSPGQDTLILSTREFITHSIKAVVFIYDLL